MIIRSQDGDIAIIGVGSKFSVNENQVFCTVSSGESSIWLGSYQSSEEAQGVLDEIFRDYGRARRYEMPKYGWSDGPTVVIDGSIYRADEVDIEYLDLSVRAYNILKNNQIYSLEDLLKLSEQDLIQLRNLGTKSAEEVINKLAFYGFELEHD